MSAGVPGETSWKRDVRYAAFAVPPSAIIYAGLPFPPEEGGFCARAQSAFDQRSALRYCMFCLVCASILQLRLNKELEGLDLMSDTPLRFTSSEISGR
jgi:hypothetical protein